MNTWMKRVGAIAALVCLFVTQSCTNLEEQVFDSLTDKNFPTNREELISAFGSAYTSLYGALGNHNSFHSLQEIATDEMMIPHRGADWFDGGQWLRVHSHTMNPREESINNGWNFLYKGVGLCNSLISTFKTVDASVVPADEAAGFIAELRVLRALYYFWLMDMYGNVPLVVDLAPSETVDPNPANTPRAEVYAFIVSELTEASSGLSREKTVNTYARANYYTAQALLAKVYLNAQVYSGTAEWTKCVAACDEVINGGKYSLTSDYFTNFNTNNDNGGVGTSENIFVIPYKPVLAGGFNIAQMTLHYGSQGTFDLQAQPWNGYCTLQEFYNSYDDADKRKGVSGNQKIRGNFLAGPQYLSDGVTPVVDGNAEPTDPDGPNLVYTPLVNEIEPNALRQSGARVSKFQYASGSPDNLENDFPILRYADILLTKAEALYRNNNAGEALVLVNQIRSRAGMPGFAALTDADLLAERGREMFYEGWRRQDLIRFGKFGDTWFGKPATSGADKTVFPLPFNQLNTNRNLVQNPGY